MDNKQQKLTKKISEFQYVDKKSLIVGSIVATLIATSPYLFFLYESVPSEEVWNTFLFTYNSKGYQDASTAMWFLSGKLIPLYLLLIWFFTCRHWWFHALLVPIAMYAYQAFTILRVDTTSVDESQLIYLIPIMAIIVPSIYLVRARIFNRVNEATKSLQELEDEFKITPKNFWDKIKQYF